LSAEFVLRDPTVEFAVLECARGGILKAGLGFHNCDISIVTNVAADHLGLKDINTIEEMARVKSVVAESVLPDGHCILNADDDLVYEMRKNINAHVALFSLDENNPRIIRHCENGGVAAIVENGYITVCKGTWKIRVDKVINIPLTFSGKAVFMIQNILPAVLAGFLRGFKVEDMRLALETFIPSPTQTPGRMNMFQFRNFMVMVDYAHNPAGFQAIARFLDRIEAKPKVGIIAGVGDRRDEDIVQLGTVASQMFDEIIIRQDKNLRGRTEKDIIDLMMKGIQGDNAKKKVNVIPKESEAIEFAIKNAVKGSFIIICSDVVPDALDQILRYKEEEDHFEIHKEDIPHTVNA
jgi:cyanophycin synthetase